MLVSVEIPDLKWKEFTDKHYTIQSDVDLLDYTFDIHFVNTENGIQLFNLYVFNKRNGMLTTPLSRKPIEECKILADIIYREEAEKYLTIKGNFTIFAKEHKEITE